MRRKLPPSQAINKALQTLLNEGTDAEGLLSELVRRGTEELLQRSLEAEVSDFLGRERYPRRTHHTAATATAIAGGA